MIISTEQVKKFLSEAAVVKPNILYPALADTIKISGDMDNIVMVKTNYNLFCRYEIDSAFNAEESFLVSEKSLNGIAQTTASETITIEQVGGMITIRGTNAEKIQYPARPTTEFPAEPLISGDPITIDSEPLYCIKVAAQHIRKEQPPNAASFVHVRADGVFGTNNNNLVYYRKFDGLPTLFLGEDALHVVRSNGTATYSTHGNYDFFQYGGFSYGIVKPAFEAPVAVNVSAVLGNPANACFIVERQKMLDFCTLVNYTAKAQYPVGLLTYDGQTLTLTHDDPDFNVHAAREIMCDENIAPCEPFRFSVNWLEALLKALPYAKLTWLQCGKHFMLASPDDENYSGLFAGIQ
jgi:hypothetical protein